MVPRMVRRLSRRIRRGGYWLTATPLVLLGVIVSLLTTSIFLLGSSGFVGTKLTTRPTDSSLSSNEIDEDAAIIKPNGQKEYIDRRGVHVIVGQYMGRGFPWNKEPNYTKDILNTNGYLPQVGAGENGEPVYVLGPDQSRAKQLFFINRFNLVASDMISVNRSLPDVRKAKCKTKRYPVERLPDTSVIIVFHNEAWSTLIRTIHSVINRSPRSLLHEIILVDDASERQFLASSLDLYIERLQQESEIQIHILRSTTRIGLIQARLRGAQIATGQVLTFLDAHCETTIGWLEPLLHRIWQERCAVVCPVIDIIHDQTLAYTRSFDAWGAINWGLSFRWFSVGRKELLDMRKNGHDETSPFRSPIMAGGLFAIRRDCFYELGAYDSQLKIWGGENIEMSLRVWQCGGRVEIAPCSHVGHIFRSSSPYSFGQQEVGDVLYANLIRVAEVWLDQWKHFFYRMNPTALHILRNNRSEVLANIEQRIQLRKKLKCKSFQWYLDTVWPEHFFPTSTRQFGQIQSAHLPSDCIQKPSQGRNPTGKVILAKCTIEPYAPQNFVLPLPNTEGSIKTDESVCLDVTSASEKSPVLLIACSDYERQKWRVESSSGRIVHVKSGLCLTLNHRATFLSIQKCKPNMPNRQRWTMRHHEWDRDLDR